MAQESNLDQSCLACERIKQIKRGENPYLVKELETGYVVLGDHQFFKGYTVFVCKKHALELHDLEPAYRRQFLWDMSQVAKAVHQAFKPKKLNYELLGNEVPHMHWHIFPRYSDDPIPQEPIWSISKQIRNSEKTKLKDKKLESLKKRLITSLDEVLSLDVTSI